MLMNACETFVADSIRKKFPDRRLTIAAVRHPHQGRFTVERRVTTADRVKEAVPRARISARSARRCLPRRATGNLTIVTDSVVAGLDYDPKSRKVAGVRVIDQNTRAGKRYTARIVFPQCVHSWIDADPAQFNE
jgi:hypothetical protein